MAVRMAMNGFGCIGRNILPALVENGRKNIEVVVVDDLGLVEANAHVSHKNMLH
ncbi:glyceraldehyde 3-phosphate dehydrogenase NAD-binding domain-containing protein [Bartonella machadoae]|uniref:glyceraldehyde 3-phosphate dehydrogenase NAD-binding domain-containing protein n=1 Tax=Bartonella machadoae TaxID=2893471 RepID=UPI0035632FCA